jgi:F420-dependent oxidoreductase-like protein
MELGLQIPTFEWVADRRRTGADLAAIAQAAERAGFASLSVPDHLLQAPMVAPVESDVMEAYTTLAFLAGQTSRIELLTLVTGVTLRHPGVLAKTVTTLDVLSGGRAWLGIGAAWYEEEHRAYGVPFPPVGDRFERLEETLRICHRMWAGDEAPYVGRHYRLMRPLNSPQSLRRPHPPILIGGNGGPRMLGLVASYADACHIHPTPELPDKLDALKRRCEVIGRDYDEVEKVSLVRFEVGDGDRWVSRVIDSLELLSCMGIQRAIGAVTGTTDWLGAIDILGQEVVGPARHL